MSMRRFISEKIIGKLQFSGVAIGSVAPPAPGIVGRRDTCHGPVRASAIYKQVMGQRLLSMLRKRQYKIQSFQRRRKRNGIIESNLPPATIIT